MPDTATDDSKESYKLGDSIREWLGLHARYSPTVMIGGRDHWGITSADEYGVWVANDQCGIAMMAVCEEKGRTLDDARANAQLIALAPELVSSLRAAVQYILDKCPPTNGVDEELVEEFAITLWAAQSEEAWDDMFGDE